MDYTVYSNFNFSQKQLLRESQSTLHYILKSSRLVYNMLSIPTAPTYLCSMAEYQRQTSHTTYYCHTSHQQTEAGL